MIQDVAYQSLLVQRRRALHRAVGQAIEDMYADRLAEHYEELAHHFSQVEDWAKAFDYLVRAGDKARDAYANPTALDFYARALEAGRHADPAIPPARIMEVHQRRSRLLIVLSRYPEAIAEAERRLELARVAGDRRGEGQALADLAFAHYATLSGDHVPDVRRHADEALTVAQETGDDHVLAKSLGLIALLDLIDGDLVTSDRNFEKSVRIGEAKGFPDVSATGLTMLGGSANWRGEFHRSIELSRRAEVVAREAHDHFHEGIALAFLCLAHVGLGEYAEALAVIEDGLAKARERHLAFNIGRLTNSLGWLHQELGDFRRSIEYDREGADLGQRHKVPNVEISSLINLGIDHVHLGEPRKALALLDDTLRRIEKAFGAHRWRWAMRVVVPLTEALMAIGEPARALEHVERGLAEAHATGCQKYVAKILTLRGEIALGERDWGRAEADIREGLGIVRRIGYPTLTWQAAHLPRPGPRRPGAHGGGLRGDPGRGRDDRGGRRPHRGRGDAGDVPRVAPGPGGAGRPRAAPPGLSRLTRRAASPSGWAAPR